MTSPKALLTELRELLERNGLYEPELADDDPDWDGVFGAEITLSLGEVRQLYRLLDRLEQ